MFNKIFLDLLGKMRLASLSVLSLLFFSMGSQAAEFDVDTPEDFPDTDPRDGICRANNGLCTLRAAVEEANLINERHTINLSNISYTLSYKKNGRVWPLVIQAACTIDDSTCPIGSNKITIKGRGRNVTTIQLKDGENGRLVYVATNNIAELSELTLANGDISVPRNAVNYPGGGGGGAIKIQRGAYAVINQTRLMNNEVQRDHGGAIHNAGTVYIRDSTECIKKWGVFFEKSRRHFHRRFQSFRFFLDLQPRMPAFKMIV